MGYGQTVQNEKIKRGSINIPLKEKIGGAAVTHMDFKTQPIKNSARVGILCLEVQALGGYVILS